MTDELMKGVLRRLVIGLGVAAVVAAAIAGSETAAGAQARGQAAAAVPEELVFVNGRIHTMDAKNTVVTTVTIRNGRFTAVGGTAPRAAAGRRIVDLRGRTAVPGIIDNHNHIVAMGNRVFAGEIRLDVFRVGPLVWHCWGRSRCTNSSSVYSGAAG